jgi:putative spermidine/putrescine transport system permease protein
LSAAQGGHWGWLLWPPLAVAALLLILPQAGFIALSLHPPLGYGRTGDAWTLANYLRVLTDRSTTGAIGLTLGLSAAATAIGGAVGMPAAYLLARMPYRLASGLITVLLATSFVTVVIKVLGLSLVLGREGFANHLLLALHVTSAPIQLINNQWGVLIGLVQYTLPVQVLLLIGVVQTIPVRLEEAAEIHGATWPAMLRRVVWPLARPGVVSAALVAFDMNMGAFTSAAMLGGGRVLTLPVLIERTIMIDVDYATGAALSTVLMVLVFALNLAAAPLLRPARRRP